MMGPRPPSLAWFYLSRDALPCVEIFAVTYDARGNITGDGLAFVNLAGGSRPATVQVRVASAPKPAKADFSRSKQSDD